MTPGEPRPDAGRLSVERIVAAAMDLADEGGLAGLTMRALGRRLGVEGMAIYHHLANKEALLDALVEEIIGEIAPPRGEDWKHGLRGRSVSEREAFRRHPWALGLVESRKSPGPVLLAHQDEVIGFLRRHGFGPRGAAQVLAFLDAYVYGFVLQERALPADPSSAIETVRAGGGTGEGKGSSEGAAYPHLEAIITEVVEQGYAFADEFEVGLDLLLDALGALRGR